MTPLVWTSTPPTEPGHYWLRDVTDVEPDTIVEVTADTAVCWNFGGSMGRWRELQDMRGYLWAGPIPEPADPPAGVPCPACVGEGYPAGRVPVDPNLRVANWTTCDRCDGTGEVRA